MLIKKTVDPDRRPDLLDMMLGEGPGGEEPLDDTSLLNNFCTLFLAGHDTTATTLSMALNLLALNPAAQDKAREEAKAVVGEKKSPSFEDQKQMPYITNVIKETMRMYPPVMVMPPRELTKDVEVKGKVLKKGTLVTIPSYTLQHDRELWKDPFKFLPERHEERHHPYAWQSFGAGQRVCLGNNFSLQEQRVFLSTLLLRYKLHPGPQTHSKQQQDSGRNFDIGIPTFMLPSNVFVRFEKISS